jgi:N-glycosylase/DNA lyase
MEEGGLRLSTAMEVPGAGVVRFRLSEHEGGVLLEAPGRPPAAVRRCLETAARRILRLDLDLRPFYDLALADEHLSWVADVGAGRLMRCPTAWEDVVKLVLTTNCSWALTTRMCTKLVDLWGTAAPCTGDGRAFPGPEALAAAGKSALRDRAKVGYRAPYLAELARRVSAGEYDPERWEHDDRPAADLRKEMLTLPGVGPYVAENLLKMVGRPEGLALDSWMRKKYSETYHGGRPVTDRTIARRYRGYGSWAGLAIWCDLTRDWILANGEPSAAWDDLA